MLINAKRKKKKKLVRQRMVMKVFLTNNDMEYNCYTFVVYLDRAPSNKKGMGKKKERAWIGKDKIRRDKNCLSRSNSYEKRNNPLIRYDRLETQQPPLPPPLEAHPSAPFLPSSFQPSSNTIDTNNSVHKEAENIVRVERDDI